MLITNSSLVVPHNLIHKCEHASINKSIKVFVSKKPTRKHKKKNKIKIYINKKEHTNQKKLKKKHKMKKETKIKDK